MPDFKKVILIGDIAGHDTFHVGDEAMLEANIELLGRLLPDACVTAVSRDPAYTTQIYGVDAVACIGFAAISAHRVAELARIDGWVESAISGAGPIPDAFRVLLEADLLVISGGGNLSSTWPQHILERLALVRLARRRGMPIIVLGQTLGPNLEPCDRSLVAEILDAAQWVGLREAPSTALAIELGTPLEKIDYQLDDAIFLPARPIETLWPRMPDGSEFSLVIAVTLHMFVLPDLNDPLLDQFARELDRVVEKTGAHLLFIPHVRLLKDGTDLGDRAMGEALARRMAHHEAMTVLDVQGARETVWLTQQADMVLSSRYHPLVFGLAAQKPCLGLTTDGYTHIKLQGALIHAGLGENFFPIDRLSVTGLADKLLGIHFAGKVVGTERLRWRNAELDRERRLSLCLHGQTEKANDIAGVGAATRDGLLVEALSKALAGNALADWNRRDLVRMLDHWQETAEEAVNYARSLEAERTKRYRWWFRRA